MCDRVLFFCYRKLKVAGKLHTSTQLSTMRILEHIVSDPKTCLWIFDLDDTLIKTRSGKKFPIDNKDYVWQFKPSVDGADIMIYTNQGGLKSIEQVDYFMIKAQEIFDTLIEINPSANVYFIVADGTHTEYRKPSGIGFKKIITDDMYKQLIMVGDAAGREKDHSDSDYKFAINICAYFLVPESYRAFVDQHLPHDDVKAIDDFVLWADKNVSEQDKIDFEYLDLHSYTSVRSGKTCVSSIETELKHVYIMCGRQGSGKTSFAMNTKLRNKESILIPYTTAAATVRSLKCSIPNSTSTRQVTIIVDGTFPSRDSRKKIIDVVTTAGYTPVILHVKTPAEICKHNRLYREYMFGEKHVPEVAVRKFDSSFERPSTSREGVDVISIDFVIDENTVDNEYFSYYY